MKEVIIFCDGSGTTAEWPCGFAAILRCGGNERQLSGALVSGTNNTAEIMAAVIALEALKQPCKVSVTSDSEYLVKSMAHGHVARWKKNGWTKKVFAPGVAEKYPDILAKHTVANAVHWQRLLVAATPHKISWHWVRGHNGHPENTLCDKLAKDARKNYLDYIL